SARASSSERSGMSFRVETDMASLGGTKVVKTIPPPDLPLIGGGTDRRFWRDIAPRNGRPPLKGRFGGGPTGLSYLAQQFIGSGTRFAGDFRAGQHAGHFF